MQNSSKNEKTLRPKKTNKKSEKSGEIDINIKRSHSTQFISVSSPGFISSKVLRCQILHSFLNDTFGYYSFTLQDILDHMPIDLYFKIFGSITTPEILIKYPMLRFVLLKCFPKGIKDEIGFSNAAKSLKLLLEKLKKDFFVISFLKDDRYLLRQSIVLIDSKVIIPIFFILPYSIDLFWQFVEISNRLENIDNYSSDLWVKRWSIKEYIQQVNKENSMIYSTIKKVGYQNSRSIRQSEILVSKYGYDQILFDNFLPLEHSEESDDDKMIDIFCQYFKWENPQIESYLSFETANSANFQKNLNIDDQNYFLTDLVAKSMISLGGIIQKSDVKWNKILSLMKDNGLLTWKLIASKFSFLFSKFKNIQSRFDYTLAMIIAQFFQCNLDNSNNYYELTSRSILSHFNIINQQLTIRNEIGELIECFKRFFLCPSKIYTISQGKKLFSEYIWSYSFDSLAFLKLSGFYNPNDQISSNTTKPKPYLKQNILKNIYFYEKLEDFYEIVQKAADNHNQDIPLVLNDNSTIYYLIHQDIFSNHINDHLIDFNFNVENDVIELSFNYLSNYANQLKKVKKRFNINFHRLPMPYLPKFSIGIDDESSKSNDKDQSKPNTKKKTHSQYNKCLNGLLNATPEFFLIISQVKRFQNNQLPPFVRYAYGFILHSQFDGLDINDLRRIFNVGFNNKLFDEILLSLQFLEEFHFIRKKQSSSALPIYIADVFFLHDEKEYFWTNIYHQVDEQVLTKQYSFVFEQIELNPGIEIFDLYLKVSYLSISNLLDIINVLIYDEAVYMTTSTLLNDEPLFDDDILLPINNFSSDQILIMFYLKQIDPTCDLPIIKLYPAISGALKNQCLP